MKRAINTEFHSSPAAVHIYLALVQARVPTTGYQEKYKSPDTLLPDEPCSDSSKALPNIHSGAIISISSSWCRTRRRQFDKMEIAGRRAGQGKEITRSLTAHQTQETPGERGKTTKPFFDHHPQPARGEVSPPYLLISDLGNPVFLTACLDDDSFSITHPVMCVK